MHWVLRKTTNFNQKLKSHFKDEGIDKDNFIVSSQSNTVGDMQSNTHMSTYAGSKHFGVSASDSSGCG